MKVRIEDQFYDFDQNRLMFKESLDVKKWTGMTVLEWNAALEKFDPVAVGALVMLLKQRNGEDVRWADLDFNLADLEILDDEEEPDPTSGVTTPAESG